MAISLRMDEDLERRLEQAAQNQGISKSEFVRRCVEERLSNTAKVPSAYDLGKHLFGKYSSGRSDLAERSEEIFRQKVHAKKHRA